MASDLAHNRLPSLEELETFLDSLRADGWTIVPDQIASAQKILLLAYVEAPTSNGHWLKTMLAPICAKTPEQQSEFYRRFDAFRHSIGALRRSEEDIAARIVREGRGYPFRLAAVAAVIVIILAAALLNLGFDQVDPNISESRQTPSPQVEVSGLSSDISISEFLLRAQHFVEGSGYKLSKAALLALPPVVFATWLLLQWWRRRLWLEHGLSTLSSEVGEIRLPRDFQSLFAEPDFHVVARELRRHRSIQTMELDSERTVVATVEMAGLFTPVYRERPRSPEHIFLIEQESTYDHISRLLDHAIERLRFEEVPVEVYYFRGSPEFVQKGNSVRTLVRLSDLSSNTPDHRLIILGSADGLFHPLSNQLNPSVERELARWNERYVLSTRPLQDWSWREFSLLESKYSLGTASPQGFASLARHVAAGPLPGKLLEGVLRTLPHRPSIRSPTMPEINVTSGTPNQVEVANSSDELGTTKVEGMKPPSRPHSS
jgi:hypothetical protein